MISSSECMSEQIHESEKVKIKEYSNVSLELLKYIHFTRMGTLSIPNTNCFIIASRDEFFSRATISYGQYSSDVVFVGSQGFAEISHIEGVQFVVFVCL